MRFEQRGRMSAEQYERAGPGLVDLLRPRRGAPGRRLTARRPDGLDAPALVTTGALTAGLVAGTLLLASACGGDDDGGAERTDVVGRHLVDAR